MNKGTLFVMAVHAAATESPGISLPDRIMAIVVAGRIPEHDVPNGSAQDVAAKALELVDAIAMGQHRWGPVKMPEWVPASALTG